MKKVQQTAVILLTVILVIIAGCSSNKPSKEALQTAMVSTSGADSYAVNMTFGINEYELAPVTALQGTAEQATALIDIIKNAKITVDAIYQKNPKRMDMNMEILLPGEIEMKFKLPMILTEEMLYVKIPELPQIPQMPILQLLKSVSGKFIKLEVKQLAEMSGAADINIEAQQKLGRELMTEALKPFDEKTYFNEPKAADAGLPKDLKADQIVTFEINEENYNKTVETIVNQMLPGLINVLLANEEALNVMQLDKAKVEKYKTDLNENKAEILDVLKNDVKVNKLKLTGAIQDGFLVYQEGHFNIQATEKESKQSMKLGFEFTAAYSEINKSPKFMNEIPEDALSINELIMLLGSTMGM